MRALVVSSAAERLVALSRALEAAGIGNPIVSDPDSVPDRLRGGPPDLVVLDGGLPALTLFTLYRELRQRPDATGTPIVFAGFADPPADRDGPDYYLPPTAAPGALTSLLRELSAPDGRPTAHDPGAPSDRPRSAAGPAPVRPDPARSRASRRPRPALLTPAVALGLLALGGAAIFLAPRLVPSTAAPSMPIPATLAPPPPPLHLPAQVASPVSTPPVTPATTGSPASAAGVRGRVLDTRTGVGVPSATIRFTAAADLVTTSGPDGRFEAFGLPAAGYRVRATADGYQPAESNVGLFEGSISEINLLLEPE